ncbi:hypothetical protein CABS01_06690 [Colletotrichum abscissum]|uniref:Uncharacterized protein n=2 Tax=Colletotrichum acutatum species complex TaxID=2707335 RepID=A0A9P9XK63_9PEZI|nr:uncharacterized protein CABS01_06690 [Colletotrichum abscissum]KAI3554712.1 hypothetical protein CABS02_05193 [Colletotrichum abscissum]KAK0370105.1 hypothetical protein CLIM01_12543 [Colletotrichum limetticola]KAK1514711.1 hypothetical protein CABS01_06690 [Colletotrichum abscissum]
MSRANCETKRTERKTKKRKRLTRAANLQSRWQNGTIRTCRTPIWRGELVLLRRRTRGLVRCCYLIEESAK